MNVPKAKVQDDSVTGWLCCMCKLLQNSKLCATTAACPVAINFLDTFSVRRPESCHKVGRPVCGCGSSVLSLGIADLLAWNRAERPAHTVLVVSWLVGRMPCYV